MININDIDTYYDNAFKEPDEDVIYYTGTKDTFSKEQIKSYIKQVIKDPTRYDFVILHESEIIGEVVISEVTNTNCHYRVCIFKKENFSRGIGMKATKQIFAYVFDELQLQSIELEVFPFNERAIAVYKKLGFIKTEDIQDETAEDLYRNISIMKLTRSRYNR